MQTIKVNLGCGNDVRDGYINVDIVPTHESVRVGDMKNPDTLNIQDNSVEELLMINSIDYLSFGEVESFLSTWLNKLTSDAEIYIQSLDSNQIGSRMAFDGLNLDEINNLVYTEKQIPKRSILTGHFVRVLLENSDFTVTEQAYIGLDFYVRAQRNNRNS